MKIYPSYTHIATKKAKRNILPFVFVSIITLTGVLSGCAIPSFHKTEPQDGESVSDFAYRSALQRTYTFAFGHQVSAEEQQVTKNSFFTSEDDNLKAISYAYLGTPFGTRSTNSDQAALDYIDDDFAGFCESKNGYWNNRICTVGQFVLFKLWRQVVAKYDETEKINVHDVMTIGTTIVWTGAPYVNVTLLIPKGNVTNSSFSILKERAVYTKRTTKIKIYGTDQTRRVDAIQNVFVVNK